MKIESQKVKVNKSQEELFKFLSEMENYEQLMPDNAESFNLIGDNKGFDIKLKGLPKVGMKRMEGDAIDKINFESPSDKFKYNMQLNAVAVDDNTSEAYIDFDGKFNPMIEMMAKKPLKNFLETIVENLGKI